MKSKAQMSRFHNWVNHVMKPCAFVVELQAGFTAQPIRERLPCIQGEGRRGMT